MLSAHAITIALSKNNAQRANSSAAPASDFKLADGLFMGSTLLNTVFVSGG
jgi:hypothetical protein